MMRDILRQTCVKDLGHMVVAEAGKGTEAITLITQSHPDLVILDLQLPELDGLAVLDAIRAKAETCRILDTVVVLQRLYDLSHRKGESGRVCGQELEFGFIHTRGFDGDLFRRILFFQKLQ